MNIFNVFPLLMYFFPVTYRQIIVLIVRIRRFLNIITKILIYKISNDSISIWRVCNEDEETPRHYHEMFISPNM